LGGITPRSRRRIAGGEFNREARQIVVMGISFGAENTLEVISTSGLVNDTTSSLGSMKLMLWLCSRSTDRRMLMVEGEQPTDQDSYTATATPQYWIDFGAQRLQECLCQS
jgi:hypothetical protein